jgi:urate oxidase
MSLELSHSRYGESGVRVLRLTRRGDRHEIKDLTVDIVVECDFDDTHVTGDNRRILPADTMKNTVYALAGKHASGEIEEFALALSHHFILEHDQLSSVEVTVREHRWSRIPFGGKPHDYAFSHGGDEKRTTTVQRTREKVIVESGIEELRVLKTRRVGYEGYLRDRYTTLPETGDGILATILDVSWRYGWIEIPFGLHWQQVREVVLSTFAEHVGRSVQHTLYAMAQAALEQCPPIAEIRLRMPSQPHVLVDLQAFGLTNEGEVYQIADEPAGVVEATVRREEGA